MSLKSISRKSLIVVAAIVVITIVVILLIQNSGLSHNAKVFTVNDNNVTYGEFRLISEKHRGEVVTYFYSTHNVNEGLDFWGNDTYFGGESPLQKLKDMTIQTLTKVKVEQQLMVEYGIIDSSEMSYKVFKKLLRAENSKRAELIASGGEVYGPEQYTESSYFDYLHNIRLQELREAVFRKANTQNTEDRFTDTLLNSLIDERMKNVSVNINDSVYERIVSIK